MIFFQLQHRTEFIELENEIYQENIKKYQNVYQLINKYGEKIVSELKINKPENESNT